MKRVSAFAEHLFIVYCRGLTALKRELAKKMIRSEFEKYIGFEEVDSDS